MTDAPDFFKDLAIPLPVSLVSTVDRMGRPNASPKSWWTPVSYKPPILAISVKPTSDTAANIEETGAWIWHLPPRWLAKKVLHTAKALPRGECELNDVGLDWEWFEHEKLPNALPRVSGMPFAVCWVLTKVALGDHVLFVGQVGVGGGFHPEVGAEEIVLHRGRNRFVALGPEFEVEPY